MSTRFQPGDLVHLRSLSGTASNYVGMILGTYLPAGQDMMLFTILYRHQNDKLEIFSTPRPCWYATIIK